MPYIDLTHPISSSMSTYPSDPNVMISKEKSIENNNSLLHSFKMGTHTGTHLDVPAHILINGKTLDEYSLICFTGSAIRLDISNISDLNNLKKVGADSAIVGRSLYESKLNLSEAIKKIGDIENTAL